MSTGILPYDLALLFSEGQRSGFAVIERDMGVGDAYGGESSPNWRTLSTVPCVLVWNRSTGTRSASRTYVTPARTVSEQEGMFVIPAGTDVTEEDRVARFVDADGNVIEDGLFLIGVLLEQGTHLELYVERAHLGG